MKEEMEQRNSKNKFELEGNVANISDIYTNTKGKKSLRFDLGQNNKDNTQFIPIVLKGKLVESYGEKIQKGDWITIKGRISTYMKSIEKDANSFNRKVIEILGFEIEDHNKKVIYKSDGSVIDKKNEKEEKER